MNDDTKRILEEMAGRYVWWRSAAEAAAMIAPQYPDERLCATWMATEDAWKQAKQGRGAAELVAKLRLGTGLKVLERMAKNRGLVLNSPRTSPSNRGVTW